MPEPARYLNKGIQSGTGMTRYRTEIQDAGIPIPAASTSMPMPSFDISYSDKSQTPFLVILQNQIIFFSFHCTNYVKDLNQLGFHFYVVRRKALYRRAS
jgi:hypothetical protein